MPNGVDLAVFNPGSRHDDPIAQVGHPRLLVIGTFDRWVDLNLLRNLMLRRPDWSLLLAGESKADLELLTALPNVTFLGQVQLDRLPALIAGCDVGLAPFFVEPFTVKGSPGKVYQYLAMGLPVLCTPFADPSVFAGQISVAAGDPVDFEEAIENLLDSNSPELAAARQAFAAEQSWSVRFDAVEEALACILAEESGKDSGSARDDRAQATE